jgi:DNA polymerase-3 subunit alpha
MGKKIKAEMDAQRERSSKAPVARGVAKADAVTIFDLVAKFASYGSTSRHAAAYAVVRLPDGLPKANFPVGSSPRR